MQSEFLAFLTDEISNATAQLWVERQGLPKDCMRRGNIEACAQFFDTNMPPRLLLVDIDGVIDPAAVLAQLVVRLGHDTKIVAVGSANDVGLYRHLHTAGATDYLVKPLMSEQLTQVIAQSIRGDTSLLQEGQRDAKIVVMLGVRGGVGSSTLAVNTAWILAQKKNRATALLDLDMQFGTAALALDLQPAAGLKELLSASQRVDQLMVASALTSVTERLSVLSAEEAVDDMIHVDGQAVTALMKEMRPNFDFVLVDLPRHLITTQKRLLVLAHEIVLVSELSLVGIRDTLRLRTMLKSLGVTGRITVVGSKTAASAAMQVDEATFTKGIQARVDFSMPEDVKSVAAANNSGKSLLQVAEGSPLTKTISALAEYLIGTEKTAKEKTGGFFGWMKRDKKSEAEPNA